jgi:signal transduction histidine kinase
MIDSEKQRYIKEQVDIDYVLKSKNSALAFFFVGLLFLYLQEFDEAYRSLVLALSISVMILAILRFMNASTYINGKRSIRSAVFGVTSTVMINCGIWSLIGILSILSFNDNNFQILITFIILIAIAASAIVTISHKKFIFISMSMVTLFPQVFYAYFKYQTTGDTNMLWIAGYAAINIAYNVRQGKLVRSELEKRFSMEYDLKKTLDEIALSKRNLEEESIKTFHASRLSSLGEMAGGVAHEINNPLTIIQGMIKLVLAHNDLILDEYSKSKLNKINAAA